MLAAFVAMAVFALTGWEPECFGALAVLTLAFAVWRIRGERVSRVRRPRARTAGQPIAGRQEARRTAVRGPRDPRIDPTAGAAESSPFRVAGSGEPRYWCPVCGFQGLARPPLPVDWTDETCPSCGFQFGVTYAVRRFTYADWRRDWADGGFRWCSGTRPEPPGWDPHAQLLALAESGLGARAGVEAAEGAGPYTCPCCGYLTLPARWGWDICVICGWEDDGQDDSDADDVYGGPNGSYSLSAYRDRYLAGENERDAG